LTDNDIMEIFSVISKPDRILFLGYDKKTDSNKFAFLGLKDKKEAGNDLKNE